MAQAKQKTILITGISGYVSQYLLRFVPENVRVLGTTRRLWTPAGEAGIPVYNLDLTRNVLPQLEQIDLPVDVILHTAAVSNLGQCQNKPELARRVNAQATAELARWCKSRNIRLIYFSTDIVFKGDHPPYDEQAQPDPINVYGQTKWEGEIAVQESGADFAIGRIALGLGRGLNGTRNFIDWFLERLENRQPLTLFKDEIRTATYAAELAKRFWQLALSKETGIFHVCGAQPLDRFSLGKAFCDYLGKGHDLLTPISLQDMKDYPRPADVSLISTRTVDGLEFKINSILEFIPLLLGLERSKNARKNK